MDLRLKIEIQSSENDVTVVVVEDTAFTLDGSQIKQNTVVS